MGKRYILAKTGTSTRRLNCQDILKIHFIRKKINPPLPKLFDSQFYENLKCNSPTETQACLEENTEKIQEMFLI